MNVLSVATRLCNLDDDVAAAVGNISGSKERKKKNNNNCVSMASQPSPNRQLIICLLGPNTHAINLSAAAATCIHPQT